MVLWRLNEALNQRPSNFQVHTSYLVIMQILTHQVWAARFCISLKLTGDAGAAGPCSKDVKKWSVCTHWFSLEISSHHLPAQLGFITASLPFILLLLLLAVMKQLVWIGCSLYGRLWTELHTCIISVDLPYKSYKLGTSGEMRHKELSQGQNRVRMQAGPLMSDPGVFSGSAQCSLEEPNTWDGDSRIW